ncbi:hypothetical protein HMPREF0762_01732 [Slackia exigua ATCC 700122]|uniref:Uncharacterized protein n=1 Tax=Slackia exigua (strain ATCC 700122 / DSM 15923 / CIP 105133 / JCM 11022 / KCTC 5966 / S-7) TaxID=649764 RepID=D0WIQ7_SLAES|nr:hypothetical protein HMPREF0762_01732 [Slackia exigua ATCC 700122]
MRIEEDVGVKDCGSKKMLAPRPQRGRWGGGAPPVSRIWLRWMRHLRFRQRLRHDRQRVLHRILASLNKAFSVESMGGRGAW